MAIGCRNRSKRLFWPLVWLTGLALILYYAPPRYRALQVEDGEEVIGFRGPTHELITVSGGPPSAQRQKSAPMQTGLPVPPSFFSWNSAARWRRKAQTPLAVLGNAIHLRDLDTDVTRQLTFGTSEEILGVTHCTNGNRIFVQYRNKGNNANVEDGLTVHCRIAVVDGETGKLALQTSESLSLGPVSVSDDGKRLAYYSKELPVSITCVDVETGRRVYTGTGMNPVTSPDGAYLAICMCFRTDESAGPVVADLNTGREISHRRGVCLEALFSPHSDKLLYKPIDPKNNKTDVEILDIPSRKVTDHAGFGAIFVNEGREIASPIYVEGGLRLKYRSVETHHEVLDPTIRIPHSWGTVEAVDRNGYLVRLDTVGLPSKSTWLHKALAWLGFKQSSEDRFQWHLFDVRSKQVLDRGADDLLAVSTDGRYAVSRKPGESTLRLHEFPLQRSRPFILFGAALWTMLALAGHRCWRRRLKPLIQDVSEPNACNSIDSLTRQFMKEQAQMQVIPGAEHQLLAFRSTMPCLAPRSGAP
jgi:hypothetical protein